jgi:flagellar motor switch protein FliN/FliY
VAEDIQKKSESEPENSEAKKVQLNELSDTSKGDGYQFGVIMDIPVTVTLEVGGTSIAIRNLLQLSQGSVIQLDRMAGEALDVKVNGRLIAHGEVVVVDDRYGIRLTDIISLEERVANLK